VVTVLGWWGASQVEEPPCLNWATQFFYGGIGWCMFPKCFCQNGVNFLAPCVAGKKTWWQLTSRCCWNRACYLRCFLWASVTRKDLQFGTWIDPFFWQCGFRRMTSRSRLG
jgi:hypothetical protein